MAMLWLALALVLVTAVTWVVVLLLGWPLWIAIVVTALAVLAFVTVLVVRRIRSAMRASALERELLRQASQQADGARPDRRAEVLQLQAQMKSAIGALKRTRLGKKGGNAALYTLPWYVIVGPPAAGKTTALMQSGLGFITPPGGSSGKLRGTAGTRNCDWWFSEQAILLDTAGRLATGEDDRDEWLGFLDILRKFRPSRPLEGVIVAVSAEDLLSATESELEELAKTLRARSDEVMSRLEMVLPLYVMVTKVDLVAGFTEFWGDLGKSQRAQPWGASFRFDEELEEPARAIEHEFDVLQRVLYARMLLRLNGEPLAEARARVLQFPLEFAALKRPVAAFVDELCRANPYQETPLLRGFYFSSGTQTGRQIDRVLSNMSRGFNLPLGAHAGSARQAPPQSYFVTELFQKIVFPDRHLGARSSSRLKRRARLQILQISALAVLVLLAVIPAAASYVENMDLAQSTSHDVEESLRLERAPGAGVAATAGALDLLVGRLQNLEQAADTTHVRGYLGPYSAGELNAALKNVYLTRLRQLVSGPVQEQLASDVRAAGDLVQMDSENFQSAYEDLKLYLMLVKPEHLSVEWATPKLARAWARALRSETKTDQAKLELHASYYLKQLQADKSWAWPSDDPAISRAQGRLVSVPLDELRYGWLEEAAKGAPPIRPEKIFFGPAAQYWNARDNVEVKGLYTALGWEKVRGLLEAPDSRLDLEGWVLGQPELSEADSRKLGAERLRDLYFQRYIKAWSEFIAGLDVVAPTEMKAAIEELRTLSASDGPYVRLFKVFSENVRLPVAPPKSLLDKAIDQGEKKLDQAVDKITDAGTDAGPGERPVSPVEKQFEPLLKFGFGDAPPGKADASPSGLSQYIAHLSNLEAALSQLAETKAEPAAEFDAELARTATSVQRLLSGLDSRSRMVLEPLLMNPIRGSRKGVMNADFSSLSERWKAEVWEIYATKLAQRYPFADTPAEVSLAEFTDFFRPEGGLIWKFFKDNLEMRLERSGTSFVPKAAAEPFPFRGDFLQCLNVASEITDAVFGDGALANVPFSIKIHPASSNVSEISFIVDGTPTVYRNEPERFVPVVWPGKESPKGGTLQVRGAGFTDEIPRLGDFGLFRLLEVGNLKSTNQLASGTQVLIGSFNLARPGEPPVTIEVRPSKTVHPFGKGFFRKLKCPPAVAQGSAAPVAGGPR
jgi:type VI secretion system protein ImpL